MTIQTNGIMKQLTRAEEEIMQILWELGEAKVTAIRSEFPKPRPAYNTVSTIVRILQKKKFVGYRKQGRGHIYYPLLEKSEYGKQTLNKLLSGYFQGSFKSMVSFFMKENDISVAEMEELMQEMGDKNEKK